MTDLVWASLTHVAKGFKSKLAGEMRGTFVITEDTDLKAFE